MERGLMWRLVAVAASVVFSVLALAPNFTTNLPDWWTSVLPKPIPLGLDLRGGIHLVLQVQTDKAVENQIDSLIEQMRREAREKTIATRDWKREGIDTLSFTVVGDKGAEMQKLLTDTYPGLAPVPGGEAGVLRYKLSQAEVASTKQMAVDLALETIRNRIDEFGVAEPTIQRTGTDGILIQLPGVQDPARAKALIGKTAQLEFHLLAQDANAPGTKRMTGSEVDPVTHSVREVPYTVEPTILMAGNAISDARHRPGSMGEGPYVAITLTPQGGNTFERITGDNVGRRLAIVLDGKVQSAPVIKDRIGGGRAVITGSFTLDEARDLAIVLRAGALPAPVVIEEERTVGPSLGQDSIRAGTRSFVIGAVLVVGFMLVYYKMAGLVADIALAVHILMMLALMAAFRGVLTMPGIAGIVLTLGMALDANVLINERIREELRKGQTAHAALEAGYSKAMPAILDSNITTFLSGVILFQFGSGPVKGFALTLCIGILTTIFTAVFCTRAMHEVVVGSRANPKLSI